MMTIKDNMKAVIAAVTLVLVLIVSLTSCVFLGNSDSTLETPASSKTEEPSGTESASVSEDTDTPEPEPPKTAYCFYIKDAQLYFVDSISKTPIKLTENLCPESSDIGYLQTYAETLLPKYYDSSRIVLFSDNGNMNLYFRDVSDPDGASIKVADGVLNGYNGYNANDRKIIYTTVDMVRRVFDIDTGEYDIYEETDSGVSDNAPSDTENGSPSKHSIVSYDSGEKYYYTENIVNGKTTDISFYYTDGNTDVFLGQVDSAYHQVHSDYIPLMCVYKLYRRDTPEVMVFSKDLTYTPDFGKFKEYSIKESVIDHKKECVYFVVAKDSNSEYNGLYSFSPLNGSNGEPECVDRNIAKLSSNTQYCWRDWLGNMFYLHNDGALCCNNGDNIIDDNKNKNTILGFFGNTLLYAVGQSDSHGSVGVFYNDRPYTLMAATADKCVRVADNVLSVRKHQITDAIWVIGDYNASTKAGTLYLYENGESSAYDTNVIEMIID